MNIHPIKNYTWSQLVEGLHEEADDGWINIQNNGNLFLYQYSRKCQFEYTWGEFARLARGLILDLKEKKIVALSFPKFFNHSDLDTFPDESFEVLEKKDGSLINIYYYNGKWNTATKGSFNSAQAQWAQKYLDTNIDTTLWETECTFIAEAIYPANKIVIDYKGEETLCLLSGYDNLTGEEFNNDYVDYAGIMFGFSLPARYRYDRIDELVQLAKTFDHNKEGFVVKFESGFRVKIKGDEYVRMHRLLNNVTPLEVWRTIRSGTGLNVVRSQLPPESLEEFDSYRKYVYDNSLSLFLELSNLFMKTVNVPDKTLGLMSDKEVAEKFNVRTKEIIKFLFIFRKRGEKALDEPGFTRERWFELFKPKGNEIK